MALHAEFEQRVPFPSAQVFLFFANPQNLPRIMPPKTASALDAVNLKPPPASPLAPESSSLASPGSEIVTSFRMLPFLPLRARWIALITEFVWNHHFADAQKEGPFKHFHHRHEFTSETRGGATGTLVGDVVDYEVGLGWLGLWQTISSSLASCNVVSPIGSGRSSIC